MHANQGEWRWKNNCYLFLRIRHSAQIGTHTRLRMKMGTEATDDASLELSNRMTLFTALSFIFYWHTVVL